MRMLEQNSKEDEGEDADSLWCFWSKVNQIIWKCMDKSESEREMIQQQVQYFEDKLFPQSKSY